MIGIPDYFFIRTSLGRSGKYVEVGGVKTYYESYGKGEPLLLLHGGLSTLETFRYQVGALAKHYEVILPERCGHGHTADSDGPYNYDQMAEDTVVFMDALGIRKASMIGYSDGANLVIPLALKWPERLNKFISIGGNFHHTGCLEEFQEELQKIPDGSVGEEGIDRSYENYSPDGAQHFATVFTKVKNLWLNEPTYEADDLKKITAPTLVMAGENDCISHQHTLEFYETLPNSQLSIIPEATHSVMKEAPEKVNGIILDFLKGDSA